MSRFFCMLRVAVIVAALVAWVAFQAQATMAEAQRFGQVGVAPEADPWTAPFLVPEPNIGF